jgi:hypothetical protein
VISKSVFAAASEEAVAKVFRFLEWARPRIVFKDRTKGKAAAAAPSSSEPTKELQQ